MKLVSGVSKKPFSIPVVSLLGYPLAIQNHL